jgi:hypothetical protein
MIRRRGRRRRVEEEAASERVWARVTASERAALEALSREMGEAMGVLIRDAINEYVADFGERRIFVTPKGAETAH